jgi:hypothetical protein
MVLARLLLASTLPAPPLLTLGPSLLFSLEGACFIDRDGTFFSLVLNYLRDGSVELPTDGYTIGPQS